MNRIIIKYKLIISLIIITFSITSCEKEIEVDLHSVDPQIVIEGIVKQDSLAKVKVSNTLDFNNNGGYPFLKGAIVKISDNTGYSETLKQDTSGWYIAENLKGEIGRTYSLSVNYNNVEYTAISQMPPHVKLDSISFFDFPFHDYPFPLVHFKDPFGKENQYYYFEVFVNGKQHTEGFLNMYTAEHTDGNYIRQPLFVQKNDETFEPYKKGDTLLIEMQSVDKGAYTYFETLSRIENSLNNPTTNIKGGALGYFNACSIDRKTIIADWEK